MRSMGAAKVKTHLLSLLDDVETKREPVLVTKNGRPVAQLVPLPMEGDDPIFGFYKGKISIIGDIEPPIYTDAEWDEFFARSAAKLNATR